MKAIRFALLALMLCTSLSFVSHAADMSKGEEVALAVIARMDADDRAKLHEPTEETLALSRDLHKLWDVEGNVNEMLDQRVAMYPKAQREKVRKVMGALLSPADMREMSMQMAARVYSEDELEAMVAYFKQEAAQTAEKKRALFSKMMETGMRAMADKNAADIVGNAEE